MRAIEDSEAEDDGAFLVKGAMQRHRHERAKSCSTAKEVKTDKVEYCEGGSGNGIRRGQMIKNLVFLLS